MGGVKRKIPTDKKIERKESKSVAFSKRRKGLYSKTSQLCVRSGAQVAILATPPCSKSHVSFYSFGHSSVDSVVSAFLKSQCPREDHLRPDQFWWEDEGLAQSEDPNELSEAVDSISRMLQNLKGLRSNREDAKKKKKKEVVCDQSQSIGASSSCIHEDENLQGLVKNFKEEDQIVDELDGNQTLGFQSTSFASLWVQDVSTEKVEGLVNNSEQKNELVTSSNKSNNNGSLGNMDEFNIDLEMNSEDEAMVVVHSGSKKDNQIVMVSDNNNNALPGELLYGCSSNQEFDIDQIFDLVTSTEDLSMNSEMDDVSMMMNTSNYEAVENGGVAAFHKDLEQDYLQFSDFFSDLPVNF